MRNKNSMYLRSMSLVTLYLAFNALLLLLIGGSTIYLTDFYPKMTTLVIATWVLGLVIAMGSVYITKNIFVKMVEDSEIRRANKKVLPSLNEPSEMIDEDINGIPNDADIKRIKIDANEGAVVHYK